MSTEYNFEDVLVSGWIRNLHNVLPPRDISQVIQTFFGNHVIEWVIDGEEFRKSFQVAQRCRGCYRFNKLNIKPLQFVMNNITFTLSVNTDGALLLGIKKSSIPKTVTKVAVSVQIEEAITDPAPHQLKHHLKYILDDSPLWLGYNKDMITKKLFMISAMKAFHKKYDKFDVKLTVPSLEIVDFRMKTEQKITWKLTKEQLLMLKQGQDSITNNTDQILLYIAPIYSKDKTKRTINIGFLSLPRDIKRVEIKYDLLICNGGTEIRDSGIQCIGKDEYYGMQLIDFSFADEEDLEITLNIEVKDIYTGKEMSKLNHSLWKEYGFV